MFRCADVPGVEELYIPAQQQRRGDPATVTLTSNESWTLEYFCVRLTITDRRVWKVHSQLRTGVHEKPAVSGRFPGPAPKPTWFVFWLVFVNVSSNFPWNIFFHSFQDVLLTDTLATEVSSLRVRGKLSTSGRVEQSHVTWKMKYFTYEACDQLAPMFPEEEIPLQTSRRQKWRKREENISVPHQNELEMTARRQADNSKEVIAGVELWEMRCAETFSQNLQGSLTFSLASLHSRFFFCLVLVRVDLLSYS